jgi:hypothetical protein
MFGNDDMKLLVEAASRALESENRYIESCFKTRHWKCGENGPGICDNLNERYYQFIIWRGLMSSSFPWHARTERQDYDLAFYDDAKDDLVGCAEVKGWWSESGETEVQGIKRDLKGKLGIAAVPGVMLILTSHPPNIAEENFCWLASRLGVDRNDMVIDQFPVSPGQGDESAWEFAVIGLLVTPPA